MSDLDALASQGREKREREKARAKKRKPKKTKLSEAQRLARSALAGSNLYILVLSSIIVGVAYGTYAALSSSFASPTPEILAVVVGALGLPLVLLATFWIRDTRYHREQKRLRALPFEGNWGDYETDLGMRRDNSRVELKAYFRSSLEQAQAQRIGDAAHAMVERGAASCSPRILTLKSEPLKTWFRGNGDRDSRYSNVGVHKWVKATLENLLVVHKEHPIEKIEISVGRN